MSLCLGVGTTLFGLMFPRCPGNRLVLSVRVLGGLNEAPVVLLVVQGKNVLCVTFFSVAWFLFKAIPNKFWLQLT